MHLRFLLHRSVSCYALLASLGIALAAAPGLVTAVLAESATGPTETATGPIQTATRDRPAELQVQPTRDLPRHRFEEAGEDAAQLVEKIIAAMTLEEKIGQMTQVSPEGDALSSDLAEQIRSGQVGSIFYTGNAELLRQAQEIAVNQSRLGIPLIVARDVIHGLRTVFPIPLGQAASWNPELVREGAEVAAKESRQLGIHWTFAPMIDISRDPRWGRIAESLGEDPQLASVLGTAMVRGFQGENTDGKIDGIAACPKHFVAYGLAEGGRDYNRTMVSRNELRNVYLKPFKACVDAHCRTLMTGFNSVNGTPATGHQPLVRDLLKAEWGFSGFVVSDWASVTEMIAHGYVEDKSGAARAGLRAGVDLEMCSTCYRENLAELVANHTLSEDLIDDAVRRLLRAKVDLQLFSEPYARQREDVSPSKSHLQSARLMARQSLVLLKNDRVLPLQQKGLKKVAVIGPLADAAKDQLGTWVLDGKPEEAITPLDALKELLGDEVDVTHVPCLDSKYDPGLKQFDTALAAAKHADVALVFVGEEEALSGEAHSRSDLSLPGSQGRLVKKLGELDVPVVIVVLAGRPLTIGAQVEQADAVLYAWHPGTMGGPAIADILFGVESPSGKLPVTFPKVVGQVPLYYNHPNTGRPSPRDYVAPPLQDVKNLPANVRYSSHYVDTDPYPLFPFGFGLSYASFEYSDLQVSSESLSTSLSAEGTLEVSVRLKNTSQIPGTEIVQLYVRDKVASVVRPVKELKAFQRISLEPGETTEVVMQVPATELGFYNEAEQFVIEPGDFQLWVGGSSAAELTASFAVE